MHPQPSENPPAVTSVDPDSSDDPLQGVLKWLEPVIDRKNRYPVPRNPDQDPTIRELLDAGVVVLIERFLDFRDEPNVTAYTNANEILGSIPLQTVMDRFVKAQGSTTDGRKAHRDRITSRWGTAVRYQRDLLRYVYRLSVDRNRIQNTAATLPQMLQMPFGELVETLAASETDLVQRDPLLRLRLVLQAAFPNDPEILALTRDAYRLTASSWAGIYEAISDAYGLSLDKNSGLGFIDIAHMFNSIIEGANLRRRIDPELGTLSDNSHVSVRMIQMLLAQLLGRPWSELAGLRASTT